MSWYEKQVENSSLVEHFCTEFKGKVSLVHPKCTYLLWLGCRGLGRSDRGLTKLFLHDAGTHLRKGAIFGAGGSGFIRMNIACPQALVKEAIIDIKKQLF